MENDQELLADLQDGISIIIPTWNNLVYLQKCIQSIRKYSAQPHEIIVHVNEGKDGTIQYLDKENILHSHTKQNAGVCRAVNEARKLATKRIIGFANDDMVFLPKWDSHLFKFVEDQKIQKLSWLSSTMIEPKGNNPCCLAPHNYGMSVDEFQEEALLNDLPKLYTMRKNMGGSTWPPTFLHADVFDSIGGFSEEFFPGRGSDPDLAKKLWDKGCRVFVGVGNSLVYHFGSKTIKRFRCTREARQMFEAKHGMSIDHFVNIILKRGTEYTGPIDG